MEQANPFPPLFFFFSASASSQWMDDVLYASSISPLPPSDDACQKHTNTHHTTSDTTAKLLDSFPQGPKPTPRKAWHGVTFRVVHNTDNDTHLGCFVQSPTVPVFRHTKGALVSLVSLVD